MYVPSDPAVWYVKPATGPTLGPVPRTRLDEWAEENRFGPDSRLWREGSGQSYWAGEVYPFLVPSGVAAPNLEPVTITMLNADAYIPREADHQETARAEAKRRRQEQRRIRRAAALVDFLPFWIWWVAGAVCLVLLSLAVSTISVELAQGAFVFWVIVGLLLYGLAFLLFAIVIWDDDWFFGFLLALERILMAFMVIWNGHPLLAADQSWYTFGVVIGMIASVTFIPTPLVSIWFLFTRWEDVGVCVVLQFVGLMFMVCTVPIVYVALQAGHNFWGTLPGL